MKGNLIQSSTTRPDPGVEFHKSGLRRSPRMTKAPDNDSQSFAAKDKTEATRRNRFQRPKPNVSSNNTRSSSPSLDSLPNSARSTNTNSRSPSASGPHLTLVNRSLWAKFDAIENEMIVTQTGRSIFPHLKFRASNLDPHSLYTVAVQIEQIDTKKHRYNNNDGRWQVDDRQIKGPAVVYDPHWYYHQGSYSSGETLMSDVISFENIRLSNKTTDSKTSKSSNSHLFLVSSFRKYRPRIRLLQYSQHDRSKSIGSWSFTFEETSFFAITHYQNGAVNRLKTDHNPHAKGFRLNTWKPKSKSRVKRRSKGDTGEELDTSESGSRHVPFRKKSRKASPRRLAAQRAEKSSSTTNRVAKGVKSETEEEKPVGDGESDEEDTEETREDSEYFLGQGNTEESETDDEGPTMATSTSTTRIRNSTKTTSSRAPDTSEQLTSSDNRAGPHTRSKNQSKEKAVQPQDMISEYEEDESDELESLDKRDRSFVARLKARLTSALDEDFLSSDSPLDLSNSPTLSPCPSDLEDSLKSGTEDAPGKDSGDEEDDDLSDDGYWRSRKEQSTSSCSTARPRTPGDEPFRIDSGNRAQANIRIRERTEASSRNISRTPLESRNRNDDNQSPEPYGDYGQYQYHIYSSLNGYGYGVAPSMPIPYSYIGEGTGNYDQVYTSTDNSSLTLKRSHRGATVPEFNILGAQGAPFVFSDQTLSTHELGEIHGLLPAPVAPATLPPHPELSLYGPSMEPSHFQEIKPATGETAASPVRPLSPLQPLSPPHASVTWYQQFFVWDQPSPPALSGDIPEPSTTVQPPTSSSTPAQPLPIASSAARARAHHGQRATETPDTETINIESAFLDGPSDVTTAVMREPRVTLTTSPALASSTSEGLNRLAGSRQKEWQDELLCNELDGLRESPKITPLRDHSPEESSQSEANHLRHSSNALTECLPNDDMAHLHYQPQTREIVTERHGIVVHRRPNLPEW